VSAAQSPTKAQPTASPQPDHHACRALLERLADALDAALDAASWHESTDILLDASDEAHDALRRLRRGSDGAA
jgi:hypothetical protein